MFLENYFSQISEHSKKVDASSLQAAVELICGVDKKGGKVIIAGNGGSAAIASHISVDLTKNAKIRASNFNEADLITCLANDFSYENWVAKAIEFYSDCHDLIILISSSGRSKNMVNAALKAKDLGLKLITFTGFDIDNSLKQIGDINFWVDSKAYNIVEMTHHIWLVAIIDKITDNEKHST